MIRFIVPEASPSLNKYTFRHWRVQHSDKKRWAKFLLAEVMRTKADPATSKRRLTIERHSRGKLDIDNLIGGLKSVVIDNLRKLDMLTDDDEDGLDLAVRQERLGGAQRPHTVIYLEDVTGEKP